MKIRSLWQQLSDLLDKEGIEGRVTARLLIMKDLDMKYHQLINQLDKEVKKETVDKLISQAKEIVAGRPVQYLLGKQEFYGLEFLVDEHVLIPRPETEMLVEKVLELLGNKEAKVLDIGTGSGAIAVSIAKNMDKCEITAVDISEAALDVAKKNAKNNKVFAKINFVNSDLFTNLQDNNYDCIVSNPPYIKQSEMSNLPKNVMREPEIALAGGEDGLFFYREIITEGIPFLNSSGFLAFEIGCEQGLQVKSMMKDAGYKNIKIIKDFNALDRVVIGFK